MRFKGHIFRHVTGDILCEMVGEETGRVFFIYAPEQDSKGQKLSPGDQCWAEIEDGKFLYEKFEPRDHLSREELDHLFAEMDARLGNKFDSK